MSKDPAFLFYPGDWLGGTLGMTFEEKGAYIELLMLQFNRGHMTEHMIGQTVGQIWVNLQDKFQKDKDGKWFNERLDIEKEKRKNFVNSRNNNRNGENQYTKGKKDEVKNSGHTRGHMTYHMENENRNENKDINKEEDKNHSKICLKILTDFKFTQQRNSDKLSKISDFIRQLKAANKFDWFVIQYQSYWPYKNSSGQEKQSLETFINDGWDRENWTEKLKEQNGKQTRESRQQSVDELREAASKILRVDKS